MTTLFDTELPNLPSKLKTLYEPTPCIHENYASIVAYHVVGAIHSQLFTREVLL